MKNKKLWYYILMLVIPSLLTAPELRGTNLPYGCVKVSAGLWCVGSLSMCANRTLVDDYVYGPLGSDGCGGGQEPKYHRRVTETDFCKYCCDQYAYVQTGVDPCPPGGCENFGSRVVLTIPYVQQVKVDCIDYV